MKILPASLALLLLLACEDTSKTTSPVESSLSADENAPTLAPASLEAEVEFGSDEVGSPFPPAQHDNSFHAFDKIRPHVIHLQRGAARLHVVLAGILGHLVHQLGRHVLAEELGELALRARLDEVAVRHVHDIQGERHQH